MRLPKFSLKWLRRKKPERAVKKTTAKKTVPKKKAGGTK